MGKITANDFFILWNSFIQNKILNKPAWKEWYDDDKTWTIKTIGVKTSETENSHLVIIIF